jgi:hypothetical protein
MYVGLIVIISVQHHFKTAFGGPLTEVFNKRAILVQRMDRPPPAELLWDPLTWPCSTERNHGERDRAPLAYFTIHSLEFFRLCEKARVVVSNAKMHTHPLYIRP